MTRHIPKSHHGCTRTHRSWEQPSASHPTPPPKQRRKPQNRRGEEKGNTTHLTSVPLACTQLSDTASRPPWPRMASLSVSPRAAPSAAPSRNHLHLAARRPGRCHHPCTSNENAPPAPVSQPPSRICHGRREAEPWWRCKRPRQSLRQEHAAKLPLPSSPERQHRPHLHDATTVKPSPPRATTSRPSQPSWRQRPVATQRGRLTTVRGPNRDDGDGKTRSGHGEHESSHPARRSEHSSRRRRRNGATGHIEDLPWRKKEKEEEKEEKGQVMEEGRGEGGVGGVPCWRSFFLGGGVAPCRPGERREGTDGGVFRPRYALSYRR